ncbi:mannose-1-phosphate guanylyltransferase [Leadbettera azotonutricia]|uniref:Mannose-1-phosphate guanylyltransferase [GDP] (GDP-mannose pyrophosphorylase) (GMP) n=1 Tax=Leadbettera azotonutricia (strain ATCC BAA-888 / DSM 13862 / ZAS-9) TaxID=545695 RepID=F5Y9X0_LEAAZ|nr:mannose-1-phosphate guanylyltransferase [Leadbettera azotonutricia]AEF80408.1 mannose-1-phosphate guanylyltransferase [GDP] (GDP-mannose pyrophosphorylase) (GMP) [Leadbettera azotonutricia ZAS-9]
MFNDCIIMAGGSGTRLWPASTSKKPKQFLPAPPDKSFFASSVERALVVTDPAHGRVIIIAGKSHVNLIAEACADFSPQEKKRLVLIPEPAAKNTAPAIACGILYADWEGGGQERNILVLTCDHIISPLSVFKANAAAAAAFAQQDKLVVFGIQPHSPDTGYGYIETSQLLSGFNIQDKGRRHYEPEVFKASAFREKPDRKTAERYVKAGNFYWNSGMFAFSSKFMIDEFRKNAPEVLAPFSKLMAPEDQEYRKLKGLRILSEWMDLDKAYSKTKSISFDYAIAEKCSQTVMVKADFKWRDVGSWDEYARMLQTQIPKNQTAADKEADIFRVGSESTFVDSDIPVALCGAEDLIVVVRSGRDGNPPAVLIAKKGETQKVKEVVEKIKASGRKDLL